MTTNAPRLTKPVFEHLSAGQQVSQNPAPRISWRFEYNESTRQAWVQKAYEIELRSFAHADPIVTRVDSDRSVLVPWPGTKLPSRGNARIRVRCYGSSNAEPSQFSWTKWSEHASVETGLLRAEDWQAQWITSPEKQPDGPLRPLRFYKSFVVPSDNGASLKARLYITSMGVFNAYINGIKASDEFMAPGWSSYKHRLAYRTIDVSSLLKQGNLTNTICVEVAEGWYSGRLGFNGGTRYIYGNELGLLAQLEVFSGSSDTNIVATDDSWNIGTSGLITSEIYDGEVYDAREDAGLLSEEPELAKLPRATLVSPSPTSALFISEAPPVRVTENLKPVNIFRSASGKAIIDFGQNLVGKLQIKSINVPNGDKLTVQHAEVMEHDELGVRPLRKAACTDTIISAGSEIRNWTPQFTFHGFRYVQVDGWPGDELPPKESFEALVLHTDMHRRGFFSCSNTSVNQLHRNVVWSMRGNFLSIPTDCPQRDERLGWTGDLQVFCPTATFLYDTVGMIGDWLQDLASEQLEEGKGSIPPLVCPDVLPKNWPHVAQAVWDDIVVLTPEVLFQYSDDLNLLERQFRSGQAYLEQAVDRGSDGLWKTEGWQLADWLDPTAPPQDPGNGRTDGVMVADAYLVRVTETFTSICHRLGKTDLGNKYEEDARSLKQAFQEKYITAAGNLMSNSQTGLALAIQHNLYPGKKQLATATAALSKLVRTARFKIATGFAGTPIITHALTSVGQTQLAYRMLLETACPSWMYPITMGATTIWERWDSMLPDGRINPGQMTSFNHYALGAVADWLHTTVGGISAAEPGWKKINVRPIPGGNLTSADVSFDGPYGWVRCKWTLEGADFTMVLHVPPNSSASVTLPSENETTTSRVVGSGIYSFSCKFINQEWPPVPIVAINQQPPTNVTFAT